MFCLNCQCKYHFFKRCPKLEVAAPDYIKFQVQNQVRKLEDDITKIEFDEFERLKELNYYNEELNMLYIT
jgi:hypothetical protein